MQHPSASGLDQLLGKFKNWFSGLRGKAITSESEWSTPDTYNGSVISGGRINDPTQLRGTALEQETVMISPFSRKKMLGSQTVLVCSADSQLSRVIEENSSDKIIVAESKREMIDCIHEIKFDFIFLDFDPLKDGTMAFRLAKKIRSTGYTGKIFLLGKSSKNKGDVLALSFGADGLVDKDYQEIMRMTE